MRAKSKSNPIPIRCDGELVEKIRSTAESMGVSESALIRFAISQQLPKVEALKNLPRLNP